MFSSVWIELSLVPSALVVDLDGTVLTIPFVDVSVGVLPPTPQPAAPGHRCLRSVGTASGKAGSLLGGGVYACRMRSVIFLTMMAPLTRATPTGQVGRGAIAELLLV